MAVVRGLQKLVVAAAMLVLSVIVAPAASPQDTDLDPTELGNSANPGGGVAAIPSFYPVDSFPAGAPAGLEIDPATGLIWSADGNSIQVFDHAGNIVHSFGSSGSADGQFATPGGIAIAGDEVFVADRGNSRVQVFDKSGNHLRNIGVGVLFFPCGIEVVNNQVFVSQGADADVTIFATNGVVIDTFDASASGTDLNTGCVVDHITAGRCPLSIRGCRFRPAIELFVADWNNSRVAVFGLDGTWQRDIAVGGEPAAIDSDEAGHLWIADFLASEVSKWRILDGGFVAKIDVVGSSLGQLENPQSLVVDPSGSTFWVGETGNARIQVFTELVCDNKLLTHVGTSYSDDLVTTGGDDIVHLGPGDDKLRTGPGADTACGGEGNDDISGGGGADSLDGGPGNDTIQGQGGADTIFGRDGADTLDGQGAADMIFGGDQNDTINGQNGADMLRGGSGNDTLKSQTGPDTLRGDANDDVLFGGNGNDRFFGGSGFDKCSGNLGPNDQAEAATCEQTPGIEVLF